MCSPSMTLNRQRCSANERAASPLDRGYLSPTLASLLVMASVALLFNLSMAGPSLATPNTHAKVTIYQLNNSLDSIKKQSLQVQNLYSHIENSKPPTTAKLKKRLARIEQTILISKRTFVSDIKTALTASAASLTLLRKYAASFNQLNLAQKSFSETLVALTSDQAKERTIQKGLNAVTAGGQSDMNLDLGTNREKLKELALKISGDQQIMAFAQSEVTLAQQILTDSERNALGDTLASLAIKAQMHYLISINEYKADLSKPHNWFWGVL